VDHRAAKAVGKDSFVIALNTIAVGNSRVSLWTECVTWIFATRGQANVGTFPMLKPVAEMSVDLGA
jgi:hypothetical protein